MYQLDREINKLQERFAKLTEDSRVLEARKIEMDEKESMLLNLPTVLKKRKN